MPQLPINDPLNWFHHWMDEAHASAEPEPTAMSLATVDEEGQPTVRIVLLKGVDRKGFVFYTNLGSQKARQLSANRRAGLCFLWKALGRQVRIDGAVDPLSEAEADNYFASRPRGSQIGAWASKQSQPLQSRPQLLDRVAQFEDRFADKPVPRPDFWSGFRLVPAEFEFWQLGEHRLHDRWRLRRLSDDWDWDCQRLYP